MTQTPAEPGSVYDPEQVVVRDRRRIDPETGQPRAGSTDSGPPPARLTDGGPPPAGSTDGRPPLVEPTRDPDSPADLPGAAGDPTAPDPVTELTADLQRVSAEYANYRKRVARDSAAVVEFATASVVYRLLPLLDDVERAREHGDLDGAFKVVGEGLEGLVGKLGVHRFGAPGDAFDPQVHEAVMSAPEDPAATVATCVQVFSPGYRFASGRVLRAAKVVVAEPAAPTGPAAAGGREA